MNRFAKAAAALVPMVLMLTAVVAGQDDKTPTIKELMRKLHKGANAPLSKTRDALKSDSPNWDNLRKQTKDLVALAASLPKNDPPRGDKAAYRELADDYYGNSKKLDDAAKDEDLSSARAAAKKLGESCKACHTAHKGQ
jgi:cytochrome c556